MSHSRRSANLVNWINSAAFSDADRRRFWAKVRRNGDGCWEWSGSKLNAEGHGGFSCPTAVPKELRRPLYAHRVAWMLAYGDIPDGLSVLHRCDNPPCCNPVHLFVGTHTDNMRDASRKGRLNVPRPRRQRVTDAEVSEIVALRRAGMTLVRIADQFRVSKTFVSLVARGQRRQFGRELKQGAA